MQIESLDTSNLKPAEIDQCGQLLADSGLTISDEQLDEQLEKFPLVALARTDEGTLAGFLVGSLERIGGTPAILWSVGATVKGREAPTVMRILTGEFSRRAAISFPDEDVLVATCLHQPTTYALLDEYTDIVPRPGYKPNGEERAWGRRIAKRFGVASSYNDREFKVDADQALLLVETSNLKATGGKKIVDLVGKLSCTDGNAMVAFGWAVAEDLEAGQFQIAV